MLFSDIREFLKQPVGSIFHFSNQIVPGGAAKAARSIHASLLKAGMPSRMLPTPMNGFFDKVWALVTAYYDKVPLQFYRNRKRTAFSTANTGIPLKKLMMEPDAEVLHLHWVHDGYMGFQQMKALRAFSGKKVISLHDSWWITGGCNVTHGCDRWMQGCGACPQLQSNSSNDFSSRHFAMKRKVVQHMKPVIICASRWMYERVKQSPIMQGLQVERVPYPIDTNVFKPLAGETARELLNLPQGKKLVLFGAVDIDDTNKGYAFFRDAMNQLADDTVEIVIFGNTDPSRLQLNKKVHLMGRLHDEVTLSLAYNAANVFVAPSLEDNFPNTVLESIACGTPVTAFAIGGMPDMIEHGKNGYLARKGDVADMVQGIRVCLEQEQNMSTFARAKTLQEFTYEAVSAQLIRIYHSGI